MATPSLPTIYLADDFSWGNALFGDPSTAMQNFYTDLVVTVNSSHGRGTPQGWAITGGPSSGQIGWTIINLDTGAAITSPTCGQKLGVNLRGHTQAGFVLCEFWEAHSTSLHVYLVTDASNRIVAMRGDGTVLGTSVFALPPSAGDGSGPTTDIECIVTISNSVGTVRVWADDILVLNLSAKDTQNGGSGVVGYVRLQYDGGRYAAEWFVHSGDARLGSKWRVAYLPPTAIGTHTSATASAGTLISCLDDVPLDAESEDANYVIVNDTSLPKQVSAGTFIVPASALEIRDVFAQVVWKKSDAGTCTGKIGLKSGATEVYNGSEQAVPDAWVARRLAFRTNPAAGTPLWTLASTAAAEVIVDRET